MADYGSIVTILPPSFASHKGFSLLYAFELTDYVSVSYYIPNVSSHCVLLLFCYIPLVPKKLDIDWKAIESAYTMGMSPEAIASTYGLKYNTLKTKIQRESWKAKKDSILAKKESILTDQRVQTLVNAGQAYQQRLIRHVEAGMEVLDSNLPTSRPEVSQHFDALGKVDKIASRAYGLESTTHNSQSTTLNLNLLRVDASPCTAETSVKKAEVIDVQ